MTRIKKKVKQLLTPREIDPEAIYRNRKMREELELERDRMIYRYPMVR